MFTFENAPRIKGSAIRAINVSKDGVPFGQIYKIANRASQDVAWTVKPLVGETLKAATVESAKALIVTL